MLRSRLSTPVIPKHRLLHKKRDNTATITCILTQKTHETVASDQVNRIQYAQLTASRDKQDKQTHKQLMIKAAKAPASSQDKQSVKTKKSSVCNVDKKIYSKRWEGGCSIQCETQLASEHNKLPTVQGNN